MSNILHRKTIKQATGIIIRLTPHETIQRVSVTPTSVTILVETHKVADQKRAEVLKSRTLTIRQLRLTEGRWVEQAPISVKDTDFVETKLPKFAFTAR